jgi:RHS repeat-associated protein
MGNAFEISNVLLDLSGDLSQVVAELAPEREAYYLLGLDVLGYENVAYGSSWGYFGYDGLGSTRLVTDSTGEVTGSEYYQPYRPGKIFADNSPENTFGYTGEYVIYYEEGMLLGSRFLQSFVGNGTFLSRDPVLGVPGLSISYNGYIYAHANPVNLTDPSGEFPLLGAALAGGLIGGGINAVSQLISNGGRVECLDWGAIGKAAMEGAALSMASALIGSAVGAAGLNQLAQVAVSETLELGLGTVWDMKVHGDSIDTAFKSNLIGTVFGLTAGLAAMRSAAGTVDFDNGLRYRSGFDDNIDISPRRLTDTEAQIRTSPDIEADVNARTIDDAAAPHTRADAEADIVYPPKCHFNSFSEDTTVVTTEGDVPISELEVGDTVVAYDETTGETGEYEITDMISHEDPVIVHLTIDGELIETTPEHPFYTDDGEWINAGELEVGDLIYSLDGDFGVVESIVVVADPQQMYNLTVDEAHTFFIGEGDWLVHNTNGCYTRQELEGGGYALYGALDEHGRATGVNAFLTRLPANTPPHGTTGWKTNTKEYSPLVYDKSHLLGNRFGGLGFYQVRPWKGFRNRNLVMLYSEVNHPMMTRIESILRHRMIMHGESIHLRIRVVYPKDSASLIPEKLIIRAWGNKGHKSYDVINNMRRNQ